MQRVDGLQELVASHGADAAVVSRLTDIRWLTGFTGSNALVILSRNATHFITDGRYTTQAAEEVDASEVHVASRSLDEFVGESGLLADLRTIIFQSDDLTFSRVEQVQKAAPDADWKGVSGLLVKQVARKSQDEVDAILQAQAITEATFEHVLDLMRPGVTEREIAAEITYDQLCRGAEGMSFDPIVAAGAHGALPHARPTDRALANGDMVVLDFGCVVRGYASDMTRTVAIGDPGEEARHVFNVIRHAQQRAIGEAIPDMPARELDGVARRVIGDAGLGDFFNHGLGHGVGLQTHEWPRVSHNSDDVLPESAVITIEPGVYLPGKFGIRIEDMIVLRADGAEVLTRTPHELICL